jgi:hypothetical protein
MELMSMGGQFIAGCLTFGLGLFLLAGTLKGHPGLQPSSAIGARATMAFSGGLLLAGGGLAATLAVPL